MIRQVSTFLLAALFMATGASAQTIIGVTESDQLFTITDAAAPGVTSTPVAVTGLTPGQTIAGLDYRPTTGELYALGYNYANGAAQLYTINPATAVATAVNTTPFTLSLGFGSIGFDFNPTVDRIRVVGATTKKNYRLNPVTGAIAATDGDLGYAAGDPNAAATPSIGAVAYTNSYIGSETTSLYDYDESLNILALQNPPNNGTLNTIGASRVAINTNNRSVDMDIYFDPMTKVNRAFLVANTGTGSVDGLFTVNLSTGAATLTGAIGLPVKDIAVVIDRNVGPLNGRLMYALTRTNRNLISFSASAPDRLRSSLALTGITPGQTMVGIDYRPANGVLYGLGYNPGSRQYQVYTINADSGIVSAVNGASDTMDLGGNVNSIGFDFNPVVDRIRVVSGTNRNNYRLNPDSGKVVATDLPLQWNGADSNASLPVRIGSIAYTNSYPHADTTRLFGFSDTSSVFVLINPPNNGTLNTAFRSSIPLNSTDLSIDIDFYYDSVTASNVGYLSANPAGSNNDLLYTFDPTGNVSLVNTIGLGIPIADIAVRPDFKRTSRLNIAGHSTAKEGLTVYPNPADNVLRIALPAAVGGHGRYVVSDITGRVLMQGGLPADATELALSLRDVPAGTYFLSAGGDGSSYAPAPFTKR